MLSTNNFIEIKNLAEVFSGGIASFFGFESKLTSVNARSDYLFAVSSKKGEREALANLIKNNHLPESFRNQIEWKQIGNFTEYWVNPKSILYDKVLGLWFEFDTSCSLKNASIPGIFIHTIPIKNNSKLSDYNWITQTAIPMLIGRELSVRVEQKIKECIKKIPSNTSLYQVGTMLSRATEKIRLVFKGIKLNQIIPYLNSIGWSNDNKELLIFLNEIKNYVNRIVLHISIGEQVDPKIGIECSFYTGYSYKEEEWSSFLDYLIDKGICLPEKKSALLNYPGVEQEDTNLDFNLQSYMPSVMIPDNNYTSALVRFISHVKIVYKPNHPLDAKAYYGIRHFGLNYNIEHEQLPSPLEINDS